MQQMTRSQMLWAAAAFAAAPVPAAAAVTARIGVNGDEGLAQPYYAEDLGLFKKGGVDADIVRLRNGAAITAAVAGGDLDLGGSNVISLAQARVRGIPIHLLAAGAVYDASNQTEKIVALAEGPIRTAKDLNGKIVGTPSLASTAALATFAWVDKNGGDSSTVQFVEVPQASMGAALAASRIAAAAMEDPDLDAPGVKLRELGPAYAAVASTYLLTAWFAADEWLVKNPAAARTVAGAISQGGRWAMANRTTAAGVFEKYTKKKLPQIRESFAPSLTVALLQPVFDAAARYKLVPERVNAADFIWKGK